VPGHVRGELGGGGVVTRSRPLRLVAVQNMAGEGFPRFERHLAQDGRALRVVHAYSGERLPRPEECDAVLVGGSPLAAYDWQDHAFLRDEAAFLSHALASGVPTLGICFGAQFLAHLFGGRAFRAERREIGAHTVWLTEAGRSDPLLAGFPPSFPVVEWHGDTFDLPPGAELLARGEGIRNQFFRIGHVVGVQFHPEVTDVGVTRWAEANPADLAAAGTSKVKVLAECRAIESDMQRVAARLLDNFLACLVRERA